MKTKDYLKQAKVKLGIESDYALAARLGITRSSISGLQNGHSFLGDETAMKIADILEVPREMVLLDITIERSAHSPNKDVAAAWTHLMEKFSTSFKALVLHATPRRRTLSAW